MEMEEASEWIAREPSPEVDRLAHAVIGAAIEVHRILGPGLLESIYHRALCIELGLRGIAFQSLQEISVNYKGHPVGVSKLDLLVDGALIVELKAVDALHPIHRTSHLLPANNPADACAADQL